MVGIDGLLSEIRILLQQYNSLAMHLFFCCVVCRQPQGAFVQQYYFSREAFRPAFPLLCSFTVYRTLFMCTYISTTPVRIGVSWVRDGREGGVGSITSLRAVIERSRVSLIVIVCRVRGLVVDGWGSTLPSSSSSGHFCRIFGVYLMFVYGPNHIIYIY